MRDMLLRYRQVFEQSMAQVSAFRLIWVIFGSVTSNSFHLITSAHSTIVRRLFVAVERYSVLCSSWSDDKTTTCTCIAVQGALVLEVCYNL